MDKKFFKLPEKIFGINVSFMKLFVVPLLVVLGVIVSFNLVIFPKFGELWQLNASVKSIGKEIDLTVQKINYLSSVDQGQIKNDVEYLESAVLQEKNSYLLVGVIRSVADKYGFAVTSFSINSLEIKDESKDTLKVADQDVATKMPIEVALIGPEASTVDLVTALENTLPILFIDSLNISSTGGMSTLEMMISSYYIAEKDDLVSGNLSLSDLIPTEEENDLLRTISGFTKINRNEAGAGGSEPFVKYDRGDPFTL